MNYLYSLFILSFLSFNSYGQFEVVPTPTSVDLHDIIFLNPDSGIAVGDSGVILKSSNGGSSWDLVMKSEEESLHKVAFFNDLDGLAIGSDIFLTADGGSSWTELDRPDEYTDLAILNDSTVLVTSKNDGLIRSTNKGQTFKVLLGSDTGKGLGLLSFVNEQIGYGMQSGPAANTHFTLKSIDGGESWDTIEALSGQDITIIEAFEFASEDVGFRAGWYNGHLTRTTDGAVNWTSASYTDQSLQGQWYDLHIDPNHPDAYFACGWYGSIARSSNGGKTWDRIESGVSQTTSLYGIFFLDDQLGWAVGYNGTMLRTTNGGGTVSSTQPDGAIGVRLFPNPAKDRLFVQLEGNTVIHQLQIIDLLGRVVLACKGQTELDIRQLSSGRYQILIETSTGHISESLIIHR